MARLVAEWRCRVFLWIRATSGGCAYFPAQERGGFRWEVAQSAGDDYKEWRLLNSKEWKDGKPVIDRR